MMNKHKLHFKQIFMLLLICSIAAASASCSQQKKGYIPGKGLEVSVNKKRVVPGDTVVFRVLSELSIDPGQLEVFLIRPTRGIEKLAVKTAAENKNEFNGSLVLQNDITDGIYGITAVASYGQKQVVGKATFLSGKVVLDFAIMASFADTNTISEMASYLDNFSNVGGNAITLHANMSSDLAGGGSPRMHAVWASKVCKRAVNASDDRIEMMLKMADTLGLPSILSVSWDCTDPELPNTNYMESIHAITEELWNMFGHHPSLVGFYSFQEGSGTYFANYVREFCRGVKQHNQGLLTMCAPNIDDPLLAGYLSAIDELDIVNYQSPIMTSYRPDNRRLFPNRRAKDVTSLSAGATKVRNKITLSHVEFMGYFENRIANSYLTSYENIFNQFPAVASSYGPDGITFFSYFSCIYINSKKLPVETKRAASAVANGVKAYELISKEIANQSSHIAVYIPYNDWCIERWTNCITPATDALCKLGISPDIIPFVPPKGEDILPYYPMRANLEQLDFLLRNKYVLILPDISGMQETDSEMLEAFVRNGGVVVAFGPRIPYGDRFDRTKLWGAKEVTSIQAQRKFERLRICRSPGKRTKQSEIFGFDPIVSTSWNPSVDKRIADFLDGSAAIFFNSYQRGKTYVVTFSVGDAVEIFPDLVRDLLDEALQTYDVKRPFDVYGMKDNMDVAMSSRDGSCFIMLANYGSHPISLRIKPLVLDQKSEYTVTDMKSRKIVSERAANSSSPIDVQIKGNHYLAVSLVPRRNK